MLLSDLLKSLPIPEKGSDDTREQIISGLAERALVSENEVCTLLNNYFPCEGDSRYVLRQSGFRDCFSRFDAALLKINLRTGEEIFLGRVEFEEGSQQKSWDGKIPSNWWCYSLVSRKLYENLSVFVKYSLTRKGWFLVDCTWFTANKHTFPKRLLSGCLNLPDRDNFRYELPLESPVLYSDNFKVIETGDLTEVARSIVMFCERNQK